MNADINPAVAPKWLRWWVAVVTLSAFGPYLSGGIRSEQLAVYASVCLACVVGAQAFARGARIPSVPFISLWGSIFAVAVIIMIWPGSNQTSYEYGSAFAGLDNLFLPLAMLVLTSCWVAISPDFGLVRISVKCMVWALSINTILSASAVVGEQPPTK